MEADLAFRGIDLRDLWRPGSGLTLRRLWVLIRGLPYESLTHTTLRAVAETTTADQIRERAAHYPQGG